MLLFYEFLFDIYDYLTFLFYVRSDFVAVNLKRPKIKRNKEVMNPFTDKDFAYGYIHVSTYSLQEMFKSLTYNDIKMILSLFRIVKKNTNMIMNLVEEPAENRDEILSAMGYLDRDYSKNTLRRLFSEDIIKKVRNENTFSGYAFYLNPYIYYYGSVISDDTLELFHDSKWRR